MEGSSRAVYTGCLKLPGFTYRRACTMLTLPAAERCVLVSDAAFCWAARRTGMGVRRHLGCI